MAVKQAKCPNCGAFLQVIGGSVTSVRCEYCGTPFVNEREPEQKPAPAAATVTAKTVFPEPEKPKAEEIFKEFVRQPIYTAPPAPPRQNVPPRPKLSIILTIIGLCFYAFPGILYVIFTLSRQSAWDRKYGRR